MALRPKDLKHFGGAGLLLIRVAVNSILAGPFLLNHLRHRRLIWRGPVVIPGNGGNGSRFLVLQTVERKRRSAKYFADFGGDITAMFDKVADLRYTTLRSAQKIRDPGASGDIDILVHNDDAAELVQRLTARFGTLPLDIYTPFSVPGHSDDNVSYLPPPRALDMLARRERGEAGEWRPSVWDALLSYCYHLLFHRQPGELGPRETLLPKTWSDETRFYELMRLCDAAGVARPGTLSDMETLLRREQWFPESETINFLARTNEFVRTRYAVKSSYLPGLAVFLVREAALKYDLIGPIETMLTAEGFDIKLSEAIPAEARMEVATRFRGGNWAPSGEKEATGVPVHFIITFDPAPIPMHARVRVELEFVDNERIRLKKKIRKQTAHLVGKKHLNCLHSSDNSQQALDYIRLLRPDRFDELEALVQPPPPTQER